MAKLTDIGIQALKPKGRRYDVFEQGAMGLHIRITPRGVKTFAYRYSFGGKARRISLGRYPALSLAEAREKATQIHNKALSGIDPSEEQKSQKEKEDASPTVKELIGLYIKNRAKPNKKTWEKDEYILNLYIPADWMGRKAADIKRWEIFTLLEEKKNKGHGVTSNHIRAALSMMFGYAVERSIIETSPVWGIKKMHKSVRRDRVLSEKEIKYFWGQMSQITGCSKVVELCLKTMLATGQRSGEVRGMKTEHLDYENLIWINPETKNGKEHRIPLSALAIDLIREAYQIHKQHDYIFSSPKEENTPMDRQTLARAVARFCEKGDIEKFTPHDLRRTFTTHCVRNGLRRDWVKYALNHSYGDVTDVYDRYDYDKEKKSVLDAWGDILIGIVTSEDDVGEEKNNVVNFLLAEKRGISNG